MGNDKKRKHAKVGKNMTGFLMMVQNSPKKKIDGSHDAPIEGSKISLMNRHRHFVQKKIEAMVNFSRPSLPTTNIRCIAPL